MTDNRYQDSDGSLTNPECGNSIGRSCDSGEVRVFNSGGDSNLIMCKACANHYEYVWEDGRYYDTGA